MSKDLTNSHLDRQNILNNVVALDEIKEKSDIVGIIFEDEMYFTKQMVSDFFKVDLRTLNRYVSSNLTELELNGFQTLKGKRLKEFIQIIKELYANDINATSIDKTSQLSIFSLKAFFNIAMLLSESEVAKLLRQQMLDVVIDLINRKSKIGTKFINQRDASYFISAKNENNYRKEFTDAINLYIVDDKYKYGMFTNKIYVSIFKENSKEYKKILDLETKETVRETVYSEVLTLISAYEYGFADLLQKESYKLSRKLTLDEAKKLYDRMQNIALLKPLVDSSRTKMASRDLVFREAFHERLEEYIKPLPEEDYKIFLKATDDELDRLLEENQDVLKRLKESE